jgi:hypothetical protein
MTSISILKVEEFAKQGTSMKQAANKASRVRKYTIYAVETALLNKLKPIILI